MNDWNTLAQSHGFEDERSMWEALYLELDLSVSLISDRLGVGKTTILNRLKACDILRRPKGGPNHKGVPS